MKLEFDSLEELKQFCAAIGWQITAYQVGWEEDTLELGPETDQLAVLEADPVDSVEMDTPEDSEAEEPDTVLETGEAEEESGAEESGAIEGTADVVDIADAQPELSEAQLKKEFKKRIAVDYNAAAELLASIDCETFPDCVEKGKLPELAKAMGL